MSTPVYDPFCVAADPSLVCMQAALNPVAVLKELQQVPKLSQLKGLELRQIQVVRHKPGRRCLVAYELTAIDAQSSLQSFTVLGKVRARGLDRTSYERQTALFHGDFGPHSSDYIRVPEPLGVIPKWHMWLQEQVSGIPAFQALKANNGVILAARMAEVAHKLHRSQLPTRRHHSMATELDILKDRLGRVIQQFPDWEQRLNRLLAACESLGEATPELATVGIHRDFYPDQVLVADKQLFLLDLDLCCQGDPCLDIGNFIAHLTEYSLRVLANPKALAAHESALEKRFLELNPQASSFAIQTYTLLTLVRHVFISTQFPARRPFTAALLGLCEQRLSTLGFWIQSFPTLSV